MQKCNLMNFSNEKGISFHVETALNEQFLQSLQEGFNSEYHFNVQCQN